MPQPHLVQTLVRVIYTDGTVASMMLQPYELDVTESLQVNRQVALIIAAQAKMLSRYVSHTTEDQLYATATLPRETKRQEVHETARKAMLHNHGEPEMVNCMLSMLNSLVQKQIVDDAECGIKSCTLGGDVLTITCCDADGAVTTHEITAKSSPVAQPCCSGVAGCKGDGDVS